MEIWNLLASAPDGKLSGAMLKGLWLAVVNNWVIGLLLLVIIIGFRLIPLLFKVHFTRNAAATQRHYFSCATLLSPAEKHFHAALHVAVGQEYWICPKVRLADLIWVNPELDKSAHQSAWNRISQKHVDFVLCDPADFRVLAAVELDDSSHEQSGRRFRDTQVDLALEQAEIPILHVRCAANYSPESLAEQIRSLLHGEL